MPPMHQMQVFGAICPRWWLLYVHITAKRRLLLASHFKPVPSIPKHLQSAARFWPSFRQPCCFGEIDWRKGRFRRAQSRLGRMPRRREPFLGLRPLPRSINRFRWTKNNAHRGRRMRWASFMVIDDLGGGVSSIDRSALGGGVCGSEYGVGIFIPRLCPICTGPARHCRLCCPINSMTF